MVFRGNNGCTRTRTDLTGVSESVPGDGGRWVTVQDAEKLNGLPSEPSLLS